MKKLIVLISLLSATVLVAQDNGPKFQAITVGSIPATLAAVTTTNWTLANAPTIDCSQQSFLTLQVSGSVSVEGTNIVWTFAPSVDGIFYNTNATAGILGATTISNVLTIAFTNDVSIRTWTTTLDVRGLKSLKIISLYNKSATGVYTNNGFKYGIKMSAP